MNLFATVDLGLYTSEVMPISFFSAIRIAV